MTTSTPEDPMIFEKSLGIPELQFTPDIEAGLKNVIVGMGENLKSGFVENLGMSVGDMLDQAAKSLGSKIEWTEKGREKFEGLLKDIVKRNISTGFENFVSRIAKLVKKGYLDMATFEEKSAKKFFDLAKSIDIQLSESGISGVDTEKVVRTFDSLEDVENYMHEVVADNLLEGLANKIATLGRFVASGDDFGRMSPNEISGEIDEMSWHALHTYGFAESVDPIIENMDVESFESLHGQRKICKAELPTLKDMQVKRNIANGVANTMLSYGRDIRYEYACRHGLRDYFIEQAEKFDLVDESLTVLTDGNKVNLSLWDEAVAEQVRINFEQTSESIVTGFLEKIRDGRISPSKDHFEYDIETLDMLAKKYDISFNSQVVMDKLIAAVTPENLQAGVDSLLKRAREAVNSGNPYEAEMAIGRYLLPGIMDFIKLQDMEEKVDTTKILEYMKSNGFKVGDEERRKLGSRGGTKLVVSNRRS